MNIWSSITNTFLHLELVNDSTERLHSRHSETRIAFNEAPQASYCARWKMPHTSCHNKQLIYKNNTFDHFILTGNDCSYAPGVWMLIPGRPWSRPLWRLRAPRSRGIPPCAWNSLSVSSSTIIWPGVCSFAGDNNRPRSTGSIPPKI